MSTTSTVPPAAVSATDAFAGLHAADAMTRDLVTLPGTADLRAAGDRLRQAELCVLPLLAEGRFGGLVDEASVARALAAGGAEALVDTACLPDVPQVLPCTDLADVAALLARHRTVVVVDGPGRLVGLVTRGDVARAAGRRSRRVVRLP